MTQPNIIRHFFLGQETYPRTRNNRVCSGQFQKCYISSFAPLRSRFAPIHRTLNHIETKEYEKTDVFHVLFSSDYFTLSADMGRLVIYWHGI